MVNPLHAKRVQAKSSINEHSLPESFSLHEFGDLVADSGKMIWNAFFDHSQERYQPEPSVVDEVDYSTIGSLVSELPSDLEDSVDKDETREVIILQKQSLTNDVVLERQETEVNTYNDSSLESVKADDLEEITQETNLVQDFVATSEKILAKSESQTIIPPPMLVHRHDVDSSSVALISSGESAKEEQYESAYPAMCSPLVSALSIESESASDIDYTPYKSVTTSENLEIAAPNDKVGNPPTDFVPKGRNSVPPSSKVGKSALNLFSRVTRLKKRESLAVESKATQKETATTLFAESLLKTAPEHSSKAQTIDADEKLKQKQKEKAVTLFSPPERRGRKKSNHSKEPTTSIAHGVTKSPSLFRKILQPDVRKDTSQNVVWEEREAMHDGVGDDRVIPSKWVAFEKRE